MTSSAVGQSSVFMALNTRPGVITSKCSAVSTSRHTVPHGSLGWPGEVRYTSNFHVSGGSWHCCWLMQDGSAIWVSTHMGWSE
jgi:hypothetical protein